MGRGHGHVVAVLLAGLDEGLRIARRAGGEEHEERLGRFADARRCGVGRVDGGFAGTEIGRGDDGSGPSGGGERLGESGRIADDEADSRGRDDSDLVVERPAGVDGGRDRAKAGEARDDAGGLERRGEAHRRDRDAVGFGSRRRRGGLGAVEGVDGGEHRGRIPDELSIGEGTRGLVRLGRVGASSEAVSAGRASTSANWSGSTAAISRILDVMGIAVLLELVARGPDPGHRSSV